MTTEKTKKLSLWQALLILFIPIFIILYGIIIKHILPPAVPLYLATIVAAALAYFLGVPWNTLQKGMFDALNRSQIALHILILVSGFTAVLLEWLFTGD